MDLTFLPFRKKIQLKLKKQRQIWQSRDEPSEFPSRDETFYADTWIPSPSTPERSFMPRWAKIITLSCCWWGKPLWRFKQGDKHNSKLWREKKWSDGAFFVNSKYVVSYNRCIVPRMSDFSDWIFWKVNRSACVNGRCCCSSLAQGLVIQQKALFLVGDAKNRQFYLWAKIKKENLTFSNYTGCFKHAKFLLEGTRSI